MKENLRRCIIKDNTPEYEFYYFHKWGERGAIRIHPEDPCKDHCYSKTIAILENMVTGEIFEWGSVEDIQFIN